MVYGDISKILLAKFVNYLVYELKKMIKISNHKAIKLLI